MFKLVPKNMYRVEHDDESYGVLTEALMINGMGDEEIWDRDVLLSDLSSALVRYSRDIGSMMTYNEKGDELEVSPENVINLLIKFNNSIAELPEGSKVQLFEF